MDRRSKIFMLYHQEIQLLRDIKLNGRSRKWKNISQIFYENGLSRSQHQCRNKWVNFVDPDITHQPWTQSQLMLLFSQYQKHSSQWCKIQRALPRRTQIQIKNTFYSTLRNIARSILKHFKSVIGKQTKYSNNISSYQLRLLYSGSQQFAFAGDVIKNAVISMNYQFDKYRIWNIIQQNVDVFYRVNDKILGICRERFGGCAGKGKLEDREFNQQSIHAHIQGNNQTQKRIQIQQQHIQQHTELTHIPKQASQPPLTLIQPYAYNEITTLPHSNIININEPMTLHPNLSFQQYLFNDCLLFYYHM